MGEMTARQVIECERECVARQQCDRDCAKCDLVMEADDILTAYDHALDLLEVEEKTGMTPEDAATIGRFREHIFSEWSYARMAEIAQAERDGRLVVLPCKVGDMVYSSRKHDILEQTVDFVTVECDEIYISVSFYCDCDCDGCPHNNWQTTHEGEGYCDGEHGSGLFTPKDFGKTVFLTREEAEAALAEEKDDAADHG